MNAGIDILCMYVLAYQLHRRIESETISDCL